MTGQVYPNFLQLFGLCKVQLVIYILLYLCLAPIRFELATCVGKRKCSRELLDLSIAPTYYELSRLKIEEISELRVYDVTLQTEPKDLYYLSVFEP